MTHNAAAPAVQNLRIDEGSEGQRLDNYLFKILKGVPKTHVHRIIRSGEVRINKGRASSDSKVKFGDIIRVPPVRVSDAIQAKRDKPAPGKEFPILFEDDYFLAIDKPAGTAVHGGSGVSFGVIEQLRRARPDAKFLELVHRLDRETSGVLLIAKRRSALTHLQAQFKERETGKTYLALVLGNYPPNKKVIDAPLHKFLDGNEERRVKVVAKDDPNGMKSVTLVKVREVVTIRPTYAARPEPASVHPELASVHPELASARPEPASVRPEPVEGQSPPKTATSSVPTDKLTLLEVTIKTGRTHQIRVHLQSAGHVIAGDDKYGDFDKNKQLAKLGLKRMFLHAWRLQVAHPSTGEALTIFAELPAELNQLIHPS
ncbi:MAG: pseudouridine synthase [Cytophagales bacterium]|nr:pseudouridine synthase [Cytophagales bacterium]